MPSDLHEVKHKEAEEGTSIEGAYFCSTYCHEELSVKTVLEKNFRSKENETLNVKQKEVNGY